MNLSLMKSNVSGFLWLVLMGSYLNMFIQTLEPEDFFHFYVYNCILYNYVNNPFSEFFYGVRVFGELHFSPWTSSGSVDICSKAILPPLKGFCNLVNKVFLSISIHKYFLSMLL